MISLKTKQEGVIRNKYIFFFKSKGEMISWENNGEIRVGDKSILTFANDTA